MLYWRAYASVWDFINSILGTSIPSIPPNTYGFFLALAFIVGIFLARNELARKTKLGIFPKGEKEIEIGRGIVWADVLIYFALGYFLGLKIIGYFIDNSSFFANPQEYILSLQGSKLGGVLGAFAMAGYIAYSQFKEKKETVVKKIIPNNIEDRIGDVLVIAMVGGVLGSKLMDAFDNPQSMSDFLANPIGSLTSGLSVLGGLLAVTILLIIYAIKNKIKVLPFVDSLSPPFFFAYAIGRLGCQFSGDGCWGIPSTHLTKPSFLPDFLWGNTYPHNVNREGIPIPNCTEPYCSVLTEPHLPTPLYETIFVTFLFLILWKLRKKLTNFYGAITGIFLLFNGLERFLIEFVRINTKYSYFGLMLSQAQYVSLGMIFIGAVLAYWSIWIKKEQVITL